MEKNNEPDKNLSTQENFLALAEFTLDFMRYCYTRDKVSFPDFYDIIWHKFLYLLKEKYEEDFPELKCFGEFELGGPYPKSKNWPQMIFCLRLFSQKSRYYQGRMVLLPELTLQKTFSKEKEELLKKAMELASQIPLFFIAS